MNFWAQPVSRAILVNDLGLVHELGQLAEDGY